MKFRFYAVLHNMNLKTKKNKGKSFLLDKYKCRITNSREEFEKILINKETNYRIGYHSCEEFLRANSTYIYIDGDLDEVSSLEEMDKVGMGFSFYLLREITNFISHLWAVKDNNVYVRDGFLIAYPINYMDVGTYKASLSAINSTSWSSKEFVSVYSDNELEKTISLMNNKLFNFTFEDGSKVDPDLKYPTSDIFLKSQKPTRYLRAFIFISLARSYHTVPLKINLYINALESLFTTSKSEVNYKISERVAFFLEDTPLKRKELYEIVKKAYHIRSAIVHGEYIKNKESDLTEISQKLDNILRKILVEHKFDFDNKENKQLDEMFENIIFGLQ